ncbi:hypothetical protein PQX77_012752 [Marasmius sp. AFHP31]|nr:hypothetical protein PQX77_012752 [Marasmius sp. AFHP31]
MSRSVENTDSDITYTPANEWKLETCGAVSSCHSTTHDGAQVKYRFPGSYLRVYGTIVNITYPSSTLITHTVDNFTAKHEFLPGNAYLDIYTLDTAGGVHNLTITIATIPVGHTFNLYRLDVRDPWPTPSIVRPTPSVVQPTGRKVDVGATIGWSTGGAALLVIIVFLLLRNHARKRKEIQRQSDDDTFHFIIPFELYQSPSKSKPIAEAEASSVSLPPVPPPTPTTMTLALGLDPTPIPPPPTRNVPGSLLSGNTNGTALPSYKSRVATLPPIPDLPLPPPYASVRSRVS